MWKLAITRIWIIPIDNKLSGGHVRSHHKSYDYHHDNHPTRLAIKPSKRHPEATRNRRSRYS